MTYVVYNVNGLTIDVCYAQFTHALKWSIQSDDERTPSFNAEQIKTIISVLERSLDSNWEKKS